MKKGKIKPEEKFAKVNNIAEARVLDFEIEDNMDNKLYVLTEITKALISSTSSSKSMVVAQKKEYVDAAELIADEILKRVEK